jgi:hypothetical protein
MAPTASRRGKKRFSIYNNTLHTTTSTYFEHLVMERSTWTSAGTFLLIEGEQNALSVAENLNSKLRAFTMQYEKTVSRILEEIKCLEAPDWPSHPRFPKGKATLRRLWGQIASKLSADDSRLLRKTEIFAVFAVPISASPDDAFSQLSTSQYQMAISVCDKLLKNIAGTRLESLVPQDEMEKACTVNAARSKKIYLKVVQNLPTKILKGDFYYLVGYEPPSVASLFFGYCDFTFDISTPFGKRDRTDESPSMTALRETEEEFGLSEPEIRAAVKAASDCIKNHKVIVEAGRAKWVVFVALLESRAVALPQ